MELIALPEITPLQWSELVADEREPWGGMAEGLAWAGKQHSIGFRDEDGRLLAAGGATIADITVEGAGHFPVVGIGGVFVTQRERGHGLAWKLLQSLLVTASDLGPHHAMLFCRAQLTGLYARLGFAEISAAVWAQQPDGRIEMPLCAMWRPLREGVSWPEGRVDLLGLPF